MARKTTNEPLISDNLALIIIVVILVVLIITVIY